MKNTSELDKKNIAESRIVSISRFEGEETVMIIGKRIGNGDLIVVGAHKGEKADDIWRLLTEE